MNEQRTTDKPLLWKGSKYVYLPVYACTNKPWKKDIEVGTNFVSAVWSK